MQHGVLNATHVLVHGQPIIGIGQVPGLIGVAGVGVAQVVPGRADEGVHGVRLAPGALVPALRAGGVHEGLVVGQGRAAGASELHVFWQQHWQLLFRYRHLPALRAVDDGDGGAPVALAADQPVAQAVVDLPPAQTLVFQPVGDADLAGLAGRAAELARSHHQAGVDVGLGHRLQCQGVIGPLDDDADRQIELPGELEVTLVVGWHAHDGAGAVLHQHVVGDEQGYSIAVDGVRDEAAGEQAFLLHALRRALDLALTAHALLELPDGGGTLGMPCGHLLHQRVLRGDDHEGHTPQRVMPGGVNLNGVARLQMEGHLAALGTADPVLLHQPHLVGPLGQHLQGGQQLVGVLGDLQEPLLQVLLGDDAVAAPALAVLHLLIGQHRLAGGAPVDRGALLVGQAPLVELQEQPLGPLVVVGSAGVDDPIPIVGVAQGLQLPGHLLAVGGRPLGRVDAPLNGGVLRRHAEGVIAHGVQHVEALHPPVAGDGVDDGVVAHMAHVQLAGGIGEHGQGVILGTALVPVYLGNPVSLPALLPLGLDVPEVVTFVQGRLPPRQIRNPSSARDERLAPVVPP